MAPFDGEHRGLGPTAHQLATTFPSSPGPGIQSPTTTYVDEYDFGAVNRHWYDNLRLLFQGPEERVVERFVEEGVVSREDVKVVKTCYGVMGRGCATGAVIGNLLLFGLASSAGLFSKKRPAFLRKSAVVYTAWPGTTIGLVAGYQMSQWFAGERLFTSAQQGRGGGAGALLAYKYMCAVKDPAKLPPYSYGEGVSLFTDKGRPNFEIRRPLDWQRVGSTIDNDEPKIGFWVEAKRSMGFGYK